MGGGRRGVVIGGLVVALVALVVVLVLVTGGDDDGDPAPTTTTEVERAGPCDGIDADALDAALGGPAEIDVDDPDRCTVGRPGTLLTVEVEQVDEDATAADLEAVERSAGPDPGNLEPWPEEAVEDVGDAATWIVDPTSDGGYGELYVLAAERLLRITVSAPPDHRREPRTIAVGVAAAALDDLP